MALISFLSRLSVLLILPPALAHTPIVPRQLDQAQLCPGQQVPVSYFVYPQFVLGAADCPRSPPPCDDETCGGVFAAGQANATCAASGKLQGCACTPSDLTCAKGTASGGMPGCREDGCNGAYVEGSTKVAECAGSRLGCQCSPNPADNICPSASTPFSCEASGCQGTASSWAWHTTPGDQRFGQCQAGALKGCQCVPSPGLTPGWCDDDDGLPCSKPGAQCDEGTASCGDGPYKGCTCRQQPQQCYLCGVHMNDLKHNSNYCDCFSFTLPLVTLNTKDGPEAQTLYNTFCGNHNYCPWSVYGNGTCAAPCALYPPKA